MMIERVELNDLEQLIKIEKKMFREDAFSRETIKKLILQNTLFLKIEDNNLSKKIIGFVIAIKDDEDRVNIINFVIQKKFQKLGYGSLLLNKTLERIKKIKGVKRIILNVKTTNVSAIDLYKKFNFRIIGKIEQYYRQKESAYLMELKF
ncbi:MAG: GNAT family N-acetyltransferase [Promethearchaeota archaeon]